MRLVMNAVVCFGSFRQQVTRAFAAVNDSVFDITLVSVTSTPSLIVYGDHGNDDDDDDDC